MNTAQILSEGGSGVASSLSTIATQITTTIGEIAPTAVGIVGLFIVWKMGMKFFKSVGTKG